MKCLNLHLEPSLKTLKNKGFEGHEGQNQGLISQICPFWENKVTNEYDIIIT